jgi:hypothetical protein
MRAGFPVCGVSFTCFWQHLSTSSSPATTIATLTGIDNGAGPGSPHPNSAAAAAAFIAMLEPASSSISKTFRLEISRL